MNILFENETDTDLSIDCEEIITKVISYVSDYVNCPYEIEVNVVLTDNEEIHRVNKEFRDIDRPTDVLSFPMIEYEQPEVFDMLESDEYSDCFNPETGELMLGDIMISLDKVKEQALEYNHSETRELAFLTAHSMLHLFGHDHMEEEERIVMETKQREIMEALKIRR